MGAAIGMSAERSERGSSWWVFPNASRTEWPRTSSLRADRKRYARTARSSLGRARAHSARDPLSCRMRISIAAARVSGCAVTERDKAVASCRSSVASAQHRAIARRSSSRTVSTLLEVASLKKTGIASGGASAPPARTAALTISGS